MIVADSIGFAATHSITEILRSVPGYDVSHGSQNFATKDPIGQTNQDIPSFVASMAASAGAGQTPVAVHTLYPPMQMKPACEAAGIDYWLLVRDPAAQIESCYAWVSKTVLSGRSAPFLQALTTSLNTLTTLQIEASLPNVLYYFAVQHVTAFNLVAVGLGSKVRKMEELMSNEATFREAFAIPADVVLDHFAGDTVHRYSHRAKDEAQVLAEPDRSQINDRYFLNLAGRDYRLQDITLLLGY